MFTKGAVEEEILRARSVEIFSGFSRSLWSSWFHPQYPHTCWLVVQSCSEIKLICSLWLKNNASVHCGQNCFPSHFTSDFSKHDIDSQSSLDKQLFKNSLFELFSLWNGEWVSVSQVRWWWCSVLIAWFKFLKRGNEQLRIMTIKVIMGILVLTQTPFQLWRKEPFP